MSVLEGYKPQDVLHYFEEICAIPHGSGNTKQISDYLVSFAREHDLFCLQDASNNIIIKKPASAGYEAAPAVILQGHMDMVCEQDPAISSINMETDGLELVVEGDWLRARGTTLGGDDGIAVAYALAILADDTLSHPPLEVLITVDEEIGLLGATSVDLSPLEGKLLLNLDSENDAFVAGCAGGLCAEVSLPVARETMEAPLVSVVIDGLKGGHSGGMIDKGHGNADMLMGRFLNRLQKKTPYTLVSLEGGQKDNAIPLFCQAVIAAEDAAAVAAEAAEFDAILKREYAASDEGVRVRAEERPAAAVSALTAESTRKAVALLLNVPNGIQAMSMEIPGLVQTSLNLGILKLEETALELSFGVRSSISSEKEAVYERIESLASVLGASVSASGIYPAWEYKKDSRLR